MQSHDDQENAMLAHLDAIDAVAAFFAGSLSTLAVLALARKPVARRLRARADDER